MREECLSSPCAGGVISGSLDLPVTHRFSPTVSSPAVSFPVTFCAVLDLPTAAVTNFILMVADFSDPSLQPFLGKDRSLGVKPNFPRETPAEKQEGRTQTEQPLPNVLCIPAGVALLFGAHSSSKS